jgi:AcrR family transcriptional regulator
MDGMSRAAPRGTGPEPGAPAPPANPAKAKPRRRRSSEEVRELILTTARQLFAARGYAGATTRDVALEAGVTEATIYRQFGTKAALFDAAVVEPYQRFMTEFMDAWQQEVREPRSGKEVVRSFVAGLYDTLSDNRPMILAYICVTRFRSFPSSDNEQGSVISQELVKMDEWAERASADLGFLDLDNPVTLRCSFAMVMGMVLHDDLLFEAGPKHPSRERVVRELTNYMYHALARRRGDHTG